MQFLEQKVGKDLEYPKEGIVGLLTMSVDESARIFSMEGGSVMMAASEKFPIGSYALNYIKWYSSNIMPSTGINLNTPSIRPLSDITSIANYLLESTKSYAPISTSGPSTNRESLSYNAINYLKSLSPPSTGIDLNPKIFTSKISNISDYILQTTKSYIPPSTGPAFDLDLSSLYTIKSPILREFQKFVPTSTSVESSSKFAFPLPNEFKIDFSFDKLKLLPESILKHDFKSFEQEKRYERLLDSYEKHSSDLLSLPVKKSFDINLDLFRKNMNDTSKIDFQENLSEATKRLNDRFSISEGIRSKEQFSFSKSFEEIRKKDEEITDYKQFIRSTRRSVRIFDSDIETPLVRLDLVKHENKPPFHLQYGDKLYTGRYGKEAVDIMGDILKKNMGALSEKEPQKKKESFFEGAVRGLGPNND